MSSFLITFFSSYNLTQLGLRNINTFFFKYFQRMSTSSSELDEADDAVKRWNDLLASATPGTTEFTEYDKQLDKARAYRLSLQDATTNTNAARAGN
jgi:hypothetical protein